MIRAVLFDMDGVLIDSESVSVRVAIDYFRSKGLKLTAGDFEAHLGAGEEVFFRGPASEKGFDVDLAEASEYFREHYPSLLERTVSKRPCMSAKVVRHLKGLGFLVALASSAPRWKVLANIHQIGLEEADFDAITSGEDVRHNKPDGEIYSLSAAKLSAEPAECLVVEDSLNGIRAGLNAGMKVLAVATGLDCGTLASSGATYIASDISVLLGGVTMESTIRNLESERDGRKVYGANLIAPQKRTLPDITVDQMIKAAAKTRLNAYAPYSNFKVGACVKSAATGKIYTGCNVENSSFGATICAERNAVLHAIAEEGTVGIETLVVVSDDDPPAPPCAVCLQVLAEFTSPDSLVILSDLKGRTRQYRFTELLPNPFIFPSQRK